MAKYLPDQPECQSCGVTFSLFNRLKHCKGCGVSVCDGCSKGRSRLPATKEPKRVCDSCLSAILLTEAARDDDAVQLQGLLQGGRLDVNRESPLGGGTAFENAILKGGVTAAKLLLAHRAHPEQRGADGLTPLTRAARWGHSEVVGMLLEAGCQVDGMPSKGVSDSSISQASSTPVIEAVTRGHLPVLELLLAHEARPDTLHSDGCSALHWAAEHGPLEAAKMLVRAGADLTALNQHQQTPLVIAAAAGHTELVRFLLDHLHAQLLFDPEMPQVLRGVALASQHGHLGTLELLLQQLPSGMAGPIRTASATPSALHLAVQHGHFEAAAALLAHSADPNHPAAEGATPLMLAAAAGSEALCGLLLERRADPGLQDSTGASALLLLVRGASHSSGLSPLAQQLAAAKCAKLLMSHGAAPQQADRAGQCASGAAEALRGGALREAFKACHAMPRPAEQLSPCSEQRLQQLGEGCSMGSLTPESCSEGTPCTPAVLQGLGEAKRGSPRSIKDRLQDPRTGTLTM